MTRTTPHNGGAIQAVEREFIVPRTADSFYRLVRQALTVIITTAARVGAVIR